MPPNGREGLLVADECHGFGGGVLRKALLKSYDERLGLTATLERADDAVEKILLPFFGGLCFQYDFPPAIADGVCTEPRVAFVSVPLTEEERHDYVATEAQLVAARSHLRSIHDIPLEPFGAFIAAVGHLAESDAGEDGRAARDYLDAFSKRRDIVSSSTAKYEVLGRFSSSIREANGALIFTETVRAANHAINRLDIDVSIEVITGSTPKRDRERILADLRDGNLDAVAAPRVLDEGVDVPDANFGIVLSASRTRRQMIQRMGRILRRKELGQGARFVIVFAADTLEDPRLRQERDGFLDEIEQIAESSAIFTIDEFDSLSEFLDYSGPDQIIEPFRAGVQQAAAVDKILEGLDEFERYAWLSYLEWDVLTAQHHDAWRADPAPSPIDNDQYLDFDRIELPEIKKPKKKPKRLSTGEKPMTVVATEGAFLLQCTGCGAISDPTPFRWQALDQTVSCLCD